MIESLEDAWKWYRAVKEIVHITERFASRYWDEPAWDRTLGDVLHHDNVFRELESSQIQELVGRVNTVLDDLAILLLFSVFEATVRNLTIEGMNREQGTPPRHLVLRRAFDAALESVQHGSFGRLTESYKDLDPNAKTLVDQVRHYRNWVAHGGRGEPANNVDPETAKSRLDHFLALLGAEAGSSTSLLSGLIDPGTRPQEPSEPA